MANFQTLFYFKHNHQLNTSETQNCES